MYRIKGPHIKNIGTLTFTYKLMHLWSVRLMWDQNISCEPALKDPNDPQDEMEAAWFACNLNLHYWSTVVF